MAEIMIFVVYGLLAHQMKRITRRVPRGWHTLADYTVGALMIWTAARWMLKRLGATKLELARFDQSMIYAELGLGSGVGTAWLIESLPRRGSQTKP